jgi:hypothetical protein
MKSRIGCARLVVFWIGALGGLLFTQAAMAQATSTSQASNEKRAVLEMDNATLLQHLRSLGYHARGGIGREKSDSLAPHFRSLTHFSSSFTVKTVTYPYTMLGYPPRSGRTAHFRSVIFPLRMKFSGFGGNGNLAVDFDPGDAVTNIVNSPMYQDAQFANGVGQFGDMMQRATFWNKMDAQRHWHVKMASPRVMQAIDIEVTPETGTLFKISGHFFGDVLIDFLDSQALTIVQLTGIDPDELPIFVTQNVTAEALGYHEAFSVPNADGSETLQTLIFTSWLDPRLVDPIIADVSTFNHELLEWMNDPFINNIVPDWKYPPKGAPGSVCSHNPFLEVGDPQGNGPTFADFPTVPITINGVTYHLQDLVMLPWFADEIPSSAENGWYDFPATNQITSPAVYCK